MVTACRMPSVGLVAFADRHARFIFVSVPTERGRYLRTDVCVAFVPCTVCDATVGEPCKGKNGGYHGATHSLRRRMFTEQKRAKLLRGDPVDVVEPCDGATVTIKEGF